jgi:hypothetical protein
VDDSTVSRRERIMAYLETIFRQMRSGVNDYTTTWNIVARRPLSKEEVSAVGNALTIFDVAEVKEQEIGYDRCSLTVELEFFYCLKMGDKPSSELNRMLLDIQRKMREDVTSGGLSINVSEERNELDLLGPADRVVAGVVEFTILYRHVINDPRQP